MKTKNGVPSSAPGAEDDVNVKKEITKAQVQEWLAKDLAVAIGCLDAIYRDQDLLQVMADFMYGRFQNAQAKKELETPVE